MRRVSIALIVLAACQVALGQNLLLNPSFQDPAIARCEIKATGSGNPTSVADGDWVAVDTGGLNRIYEFDRGDGVVGDGHVMVSIGTTTSTTTIATALKDAVNADNLNNPTLVPAKAIDDPGSSRRKFFVWWKWQTDHHDGHGGDGKLNAIGGNTDPSARLAVDGVFNQTCRKNTEPILDWSGSNNLRNDTVFDPGNEACIDGERASLTGSGTTPKMIYQAVPGLDSTKKYLLTGLWTLGDNTPAATFSAELHDGTGPSGTLLSQTTVTVTLAPGITYRKLPFSVSGQPSGTDMTVVLKVADTGGSNYGMHADNLSLTESNSTPPTVASVTPTVLFRNNTYNDSFVVTGSHFVAGQTTVRLRTDQFWVNDPRYEILGTDVKVDPSGTSLTCDLDLVTNAAYIATGYYSVIVEVAGVGGNSLGDGVNVLNGGPFANGSFELPDPGYNACPVAPTDTGLPTSWDAGEINGFGWQAKLFRDNLNQGLGFLEYLPPCPPPDGWHYAAAWSNSGASGSPRDYISQTFQITAGQLYGFSGWFAGSGNNTVEMIMRDGPASGTLLSSSTVHSGGGNYDWLFNAVSGTSTTGLMTVGWRITLTGNAPHASFADKLQVLPCNNPITLTGISPPAAVNSGSVPIILTGTGFLTSPAPQVIFSKAGTVLNAVVTGTTPTQIACTLDITGAPSGKYDVLVVQGGCMARLSEATPAIPLFQVIAQDFLNGTFELPTAAQNCGGDTSGIPTGWNRSDDLHRDGSVHVPACPPPDGLHYGSMSTGGGKLERAWQTLAVTPGWTYRLSGQFAGGGSNTVSIELLDGDESGQPIAQTEVHTGGDAYPWTPFEVTGLARSSVMTVVWEMSQTAGDSAAHADALVFEVTSRCNTYWADADDDGDVDQADFAVFQQCYTGDTPPVPAEPSYCQCFNHVRDTVVDAADLVEFETCASGPGVTPKPECAN
jgi:hypothetical protein